MTNWTERLFSLAAAAVLLVGFPASAVDQGIAGIWQLDRQRSSDIDPWRQLTLEIRRNADQLTLIRHWKAGRYTQRDSVTVTMNGAVNLVPLRPGKWVEQVHLGVSVPEGAHRRIVATWDDEDRSFTLRSEYTLETSQGEHDVSIERRFRLSEDGATLTVTERRSTRQTGPPLVFVFNRGTGAP